MRLLLGPGYGFVRGDDGTERFFHVKDNPQFYTLTLGARVEFVPISHEKGHRAVNIRKL